MIVSLITIRMNKDAPIGADLDTYDSISHYRMNKEAPIGADLDMAVSLITE